MSDKIVRYAYKATDAQKTQRIDVNGRNADLIRRVETFCDEFELKYGDAIRAKLITETSLVIQSHESMSKELASAISSGSQRFHLNLSEDDSIDPDDMDFGTD